MEVPRRAKVAGYISRRSVSYGLLEEAREYEELHRLLQEATRLIESADLRAASETLRKAGELASGKDPQGHGEVDVDDEPLVRGESTRFGLGEAASGHRFSGGSRSRDGR